MVPLEQLLLASDVWKILVHVQLKKMWKAKMKWRVV